MERGNIRILIAEDDYLVGEMLQGILLELGYVIIGIAANGQEAVKQVAALRPDLVIMDIQMEGMDGIEATRIIQQTCPTPVVILTAYETPELVHRASDAGVNAYLVKPANPRSLERVITIALARFEDMQKLQEMNASLQAYNKELDAFAHTVAHDLQSPLNLIIGFSEVLMENVTSHPPEQLMEVAATISRNANKLNNIIDELLLLAGVRKMKVELEPVDVSLALIEAMQRLESEIEASGAVIDPPVGWPLAMGYNPWIEEVWTNYVSNGIKYGGQPPSLKLGAIRTANGMVRFWVKDNGKGLTPEEQERLFVPFTQLKQVRAKGHGLGLSIVQRIVEKLGGQVGVESEVGEGSTFWFELAQVNDETN